MHRSQKILTGIFLGGILLGGIGTGVALVEYSSLTYVGEKEIGQENLVVQELDYAFDPSCEKIRIIRGYRDRDAVVVEDSSVPQGIIRYVVTYNKKTMKPALSFWEELDPEAVDEEYQQEEEQETLNEEQETVSETENETENITPKKLICLQMEAEYIGSDFGLMMENKDRILADLKKRKISSYHIAYITDVKILVNPKTISSIQAPSARYREY